VRFAITTLFILYPGIQKFIFLLYNKMTGRFFTINIKGGKGPKIGKAVDMINSSNVLPDVVCLTESGGQSQMDTLIQDTDLAHEVHYLSRHAILSKNSITWSKVIDFHSVGPGINGAIACKTTIGSDEVFVVCVHLDPNTYFADPLNETVRNDQFQKIIDMVDADAGSLPVVLAGDFNSGSHLDWPDWPNYSSGDTTDGGADWKVMRKAFTEGFADAAKSSILQVETGDTPWKTWMGTTYTPTGFEHERIDFILHRGFSSSSDFDTLDETNTDASSLPADHRGVVVSLTV
jgi:endonuclease/exonuclease/phosphatase family metal-dependent hydrolase